jgi:hypothetical protein
MMIASFYRCHTIQRQQMILPAFSRTIEKLANHRTDVTHCNAKGVIEVDAAHYEVDHKE